MVPRQISQTEDEMKITCSKCGTTRFFESDLLAFNLGWTFNEKWICTECGQKNKRFKQYIKVCKMKQGNINQKKSEKRFCYYKVWLKFSGICFLGAFASYGTWLFIANSLGGLCWLNYARNDWKQRRDMQI